MPPKKDAAPAPDHFPQVMIFLLIIFIVGMASYRLTAEYSGLVGLWGRIVAWLRDNFWPAFVVLAVVLSVLSIIGIIFDIRRLHNLAVEEAAIYHPKDEPIEVVPESIVNERWERVLVHMNSPHSSDWKLAIIEADVMLDELLQKSGYHGDSIGEMLKSVKPSDFLTLENAWEAHKVRNRIAHDGAGFELTERDAKHVIALFESVFKEFKMI